jgi:ferritin
MIKKLISDELADALVEQVGHEIFNANLYLYISSFLKNKGLNNIAKHFEGQWQEELEHSKIIVDLLTDLNTDVKIPEIEGCDMIINSMLDIASMYLDRENLTTESLDEIKKLAIEVSNPIIEERMREMISKQQLELSESTDFSDKVEIIGTDWKFALLWDASF